MRSPNARVTNTSILVALVLAFGTGAWATATGTAYGRWVAVGHGAAAIALVLLIPWKLRVVRAGLARHRVSRWFSLLLGVLVVATLVFGFGYSSGLALSVLGIRGLWLHVAAALVLVPLLLWHLVVRWATPRRTDLNRRVALRTGALGVAALAGYAATAGLVEWGRLPGAQRRPTGSYEVGSFTPAAMPNTIWLDDPVPVVDPVHYRLSIVDNQGPYELTLPELLDHDMRRRATLDCTSGWYAHQDWSGVPVTTLLRDVGTARSVYVHSVTGYWVRLPVRDLDTLLLATRVGGQRLSVGHGAPLRLVAPGRRGFWWVKWVDRIELSSLPWWWQSPFPLT